MGTRAEQIVKEGFCLAGKVRKLAQKACAGMHRDHNRNKDVYMFTDSSRIVVSKNKVAVEFTARTGI